MEATQSIMSSTTNQSTQPASAQAPGVPPAELLGLEVDNEANYQEDDPAVGSSHTSSQSLQDSSSDYVEEHGRRFHRYKQGNYLLPSDSTEQDRLNLQHHLFNLTFDGKLHLAPLDEMKDRLHNVLDIGTGTGIWAVDFAVLYPSASVTGIDLSPVQPAFIPPNCSFEVHDAEDPWAFPQKLDYIHGRALLSCFNNHKTVWENAFKALRPGGMLELQDVQMPTRYIDDSGEGTAGKLWNERFMAGALALGRDFTKVAKYKAVMEEVGFVDVVEKRYVWPVGTWAKGKKMKILGAWCKQDAIRGLDSGSSMILTRGCGMTQDDVNVLVEDVRREIKSNKIHSYVPVYVVHGKKPDEES